jgi:hypothetical protein
MLFRRSNTEKGQVEMGKNFVPKALGTKGGASRLINNRESQDSKEIKSKPSPGDP